MTDYDRLLLAADWRRERIEEAIASARYGSNKRELVAERNRLTSFANFCLLAKEFRGAGR